MDDPAATLTEWRVRGASLVAQTAALVIAPVNLVGTLVEWDAADVDRIDVLRLVTWAALTLLMALLFAMVLRTRVRLRPDGIEVREVRTRTYPWAEITDVGLGPGYRPFLWIELRDGRRRALPAPTRWRPRPSDTTLVDAVAAVEYRRLLAG